MVQKDSCRAATSRLLACSVEHWEGLMKSLLGLLLALVLATRAATLITPHPSAATPILADYSGASY